MNKSFTLIEVLISISLFSLMFLIVVNTLSHFKSSNQKIKALYRESYNRDLLIKVLYYDILNANYIRIKKHINTDIIYLKTKNSLYNLINPYVVWYVKNKELIRGESNKKIDFKHYFYFDKFAQNVRIFKIYRNKKKYFIYLDYNKKIMFEMYKGF